MITPFVTGVDDEDAMKALVDRNAFVERRYETPIAEVFSSEDGWCWDEMNANLWQVIFSVAMQPSRNLSAD